LGSLLVASMTLSPEAKFVRLRVKQVEAWWALAKRPHHALLPGVVGEAFVLGDIA
jgi:hypothetical protein